MKSMKQKPWILILLALLHAMAPIGTMIVNAYWAQRDVIEQFRLFFMPHNFSHEWPHLVLPLVAAYAIWTCRKWSFYLYILCIAGLCYISYIGYESGNSSINPTRLFMLYTFNLLIVGYFLVPAVRRVYFDPRMRWWESSPRYFLKTEVKFTSGGEPQMGHVDNISETGILIKSDSLPTDKDIVKIQFQFDNHEYNLEGRVVHHLHLKEMGFGVQFIVNLSTRKKLKTLINALDEKGLIDPHRLPSQEDSFSSWVRALLSGKGVLPQGPQKK